MILVFCLPLHRHKVDVRAGYENPAIINSGCQELADSLMLNQNF